MLHKRNRTAPMLAKLGLVLLALLAPSCGEDEPHNLEVDAGSEAEKNTRTVVITDLRDSSIREGKPNQNYGLSPYLSVSTSNRERTLIGLDEEKVREAVATGAVSSATLQFTIEGSLRNFGPQGGTVSLYELTNAWTEWGASWTCADDKGSESSAHDCEPSAAWGMDRGQPPWRPEPVASVAVRDGQTGVLLFDLSDAVAKIAAGETSNGWILVRDDETRNLAHQGTEHESSSNALLPLDASPCVIGDTPKDTPAGCSLMQLPQAPSSDMVLRSGQNESGPALTIVVDSEIAFVQGTPTYRGRRYLDADNRLRKAAANTNYGSSGYLAVRFGSTQETEKSVLMVSTPNITELVGQDGQGQNNVLSRAELVFSPVYFGTLLSPSTISVHQMTTPLAWEEATSTWNDSKVVGRSRYPWNMLSGTNTYSKSWIDRANITSTTRALTLDVTSDVQRILDGGSNRGWVLMSNSSNTTWLYSRDTPGAQNQPYLRIYVECEAETSEEFCERNQAECGSITGVDNCGDTRTIDTCGGCASTELCAGNDGNTCVCSPSSATDISCDGIDDDCDGVADDDFSDSASTCGTGACLESGTMTCVSGEPLDSCVAGTPAVDDSTCNGIDDDCDGQIDEDFVDIVTNCGGAGVCADTGTTSCVDGSLVETEACSPNPSIGLEWTCDGLDGDCDGQIDEAFNQGSTTYCGTGACAERGERLCADGNETDSCVPGTPTTLIDDVCDGIDDDCDGLVDEDFQTHITNCGVGVCAAAGVTACSYGEVWNNCTPSAPGSSSDNNCDGLDNDCDGNFDEAFLGSCAPAPMTLLVGDPNSLASSAVFEYDAGDLAFADEISVDLEGNEIERTALTIAFTANATIQEVNTLLTSINGTIVDMMLGVDMLQVQIPDPGDLAALDLLVLQLESSVVVRRVGKSTVARIDSLPENGAAPGFVNHHIAVLGPAAWNARRAIDSSFFPYSPPTLVIADGFSDGVPGEQFDISGATLADYGPAFPMALVDEERGEHGYHVLGIISASHKAGTLNATGMYPATLPTKATNIVEYRFTDWAHVGLAETENQIIRMLKATPGNVVLNTSISGENMTQTLEWLERLRGTSIFSANSSSPLEARFIHVTAAGNEGASILDSHPFAVAPFLPALFGSPVAQMNSLVVENRELLPTDPTRAGCLDPTSNSGGGLGDAVISAIGTGPNPLSQPGVLSLIGSSGPVWPMEGTSMAAPQVAGLVSYVWAANPALSVHEVLEIVKSTAHQPSWTESICGARRPAPIIDAYAALLAADDPVNSHVRRAILDVNEDNVFDEQDVGLYVNAFGDPEDPHSRDYDRFDLNGDGFSGSSETARFDLDGESSFDVSLGGLNAYSTITHPCAPLNSPGLDEEELTDMDILCYYAYSELFGGDENERDFLLAGIAPAPIVYTGIPVAELESSYRHVWLMGADGVEHIQLTDGEVVDSAPVLSPDRKQVAFVRDGDVYTVNVDGSELTMQIDNASAPGWMAGQLFFSRGSSLRLVQLNHEDDNGRFLGTGKDLQVAPDQSRYFYARNGVLLSRASPYGAREQIISVTAGGSWKVSPDARTGFASELAGHDLAVPDGPGRIITVDITARLLAEPTQQDVSPDLAATLAQEIVTGTVGAVSSDIFIVVDVSPDNNQLLFQRLKAVDTIGAFRESDYRVVRASGLGEIKVSSAWVPGPLIPMTDPPQYEVEFVMESPRWDNDMSALFECPPGEICRSIPTGLEFIANPLGTSLDVVDSRLE